IMNDAYNESATEGEISHWKLLSGVIAEVETHAISKLAQEWGDYYPKRIYYCANEDDAVQFHSKYSIVDISNLSAESRFVVESSKVEATSIRESQRTMNDTIMKMRNDFNDSYSEESEMAKLKGIMKNLVLRSGVPSERLQTTRENNQEGQSSGSHTTRPINRHRKTQRGIHPQICG
ncbi:hypothetical protein BGZ65_010642, partial [Modicella reniformis]